MPDSERQDKQLNLERLNAVGLQTSTNPKLV